MDSVEAALAAAGVVDRDQRSLPVEDGLHVLQVTLRSDDDAVAVWDRVHAGRDADAWDVTLTTSWGGGDDDLLDIVQNRDEIAWAHRATQGPVPATWDVDDILDAARGWEDAQLDARVDELDDEYDREEREVWGDELVTGQLDATERVCGRAPASDDVPASVRASAARLDRWLLDWELAHADPPRDHLQSWFDPIVDGRQATLLWVVPRPDPFAAMAVQHWWDSDLPFDLALVQRWARRYGAALTAHWGTMLQITAQRLPTSVDEAWSLAREQHLLCDALLEPSGEHRRHLALALLTGRRWFLHSRP